MEHVKAVREEAWHDRQEQGGLYGNSMAAEVKKWAAMQYCVLYLQTKLKQNVKPITDSQASEFKVHYPVAKILKW